MISTRGKWIAVLSALLALFVFVCAEAAIVGNRAGGSRETDTPERIGGVAGTMPDDSVKLFLEGYFGTAVSEYVSFPDFESAKKALDCGKVDAVWATDVTAAFLERTGEYRSTGPLETPGKGADRFSFAFAFAPEKAALQDDADLFLAKLRLSGALHPQKLTGEQAASGAAELAADSVTSQKHGKGKLYIGITGAVPPLAYFENGKARGAVTEIAAAFAKSIGRKPVFVRVDERQAYTALMAGRVDMLAVSATSENHSLTMPKYLTSTGYLGVKEYRLVTGKEGSKVRGFMNVIKDNLISGGAYRQILSAAVTTALVTLLAFLVAALSWLGLSALSKSKRTAVVKTVSALSYLLRSIPVPLLLMLLGGVVLAGVHVPLLIPAAIGIGLNGAGLLFENSDGGQKESRNLKESLTYLGSRPVRRIAVTVLQWTTVAGCIGIRDLTEVFQTIGNRTMYPLFAIACCIICYLVAILILESLPCTGEAVAAEKVTSSDEKE